MRKMMCTVLVLIYIIFLNGCYQDFYYNSLNDYVTQINKHQSGFSVYELDHPIFFLPSSTFLSDFQFINGNYYFYEEDPLKKPTRPCISLLVLEYDETVYPEAKDFMLENIPSENEHRYQYNSYVFYENGNFTKKAHQGTQFPKWFTMASYNDEKQTLVFLGFYDERLSIEDDQEYVRNNWVAFIDENFGMYYDFSE